MIKSKLIRILRTFSVEELKSFDKYLNSPYFGCKPFVINFFNEFKKNHPEFPDEKILKKNLFAKLYPDKKYDDVLMRKLISNLTGYVENFLMISELEDESFISTELLLNQYIRRLLNIDRDTLINDSLNIFENEAKQNPAKISRYYDMLHYKIAYSWSNLEKKDVEKRDVKFANSLVDKTLFSLFDGYYEILVNRKRYNFESSNNADLLFKHINLKSLMEEFRKSPSIFKESVLIEYYLLSIYIYDDNDNEYISLKELVFKNFMNFNMEFGERVFQKMQNFCVVKFNKGEDKYKRELFELFDFYFYRSKIPFKKGYNLHPLLFRNTFKVAMLNTETIWAKNFINDFIKFIEPRFRENTYNLFMAELKFETNNFEESLQFHSKINFDAIIQKFDYKLLQLKLYYELNYIEEAYYSLDAAKKFTKGKTEIPDIQVKYFVNALKYYTKLLNIRSGKDKKSDPEYLLQQLHKDKDIHKKWFEEKLKELIK